MKNEIICDSNHPARRELRKFIDENKASDFPIIPGPLACLYNHLVGKGYNYLEIAAAIYAEEGIGQEKSWQEKNKMKYSVRKWVRDIYHV